MLHRITTSSFVDHNFDILEANHGKTLGTSYALHIENMDLVLESLHLEVYIFNASNKSNPSGPYIQKRLLILDVAHW